MTKFITKTTKEYTYDKEGRIVKEVKVEEYHEEETNKNGIIATGQINVSEILKKTTGVLPKTEPYTTTLDNHDGSFVVSNNGDMTVTGNLKVNTESINEIANEVKSILEKDLRKRRV